MAYRRAMRVQNVGFRIHGEEAYAKITRSCKQESLGYHRLARPRCFGF
jgi:hypothetical protein